MLSHGVASESVNQVWNSVKARPAHTPASDHENRYCAALNLDKSWLSTPALHTQTIPHLPLRLLHFKSSHVSACRHRKSEQTWEAQVSVHWSILNHLRGTSCFLSGMFSSASSASPLLLLLNLIWPQCNRPPCSSFPALLLTDCFKFTSVCLCARATNAAFVSQCAELHLANTKSFGRVFVFGSPHT